MGDLRWVMRAGYKGKAAVWAGFAGCTDVKSATLNYILSNQLKYWKAVIAKEYFFKFLDC